MSEMNPPDNKWCSVELCSKLFQSQFKPNDTPDPVKIFLQKIIIKPFVSPPRVVCDNDDDLYS